MTTRDELTKAAETAKALARLNPSPDNRQRAIDASAALSAWIMANDPPKGFSHSPHSAAARSGQRQQAERRAMIQRPR